MPILSAKKLTLKLVKNLSLHTGFLRRRLFKVYPYMYVLLTFYDFPAEHWLHVRTTNPIESTFATVRLRHRRTKGSGSRRACLAMVFKLTQIAQSKWRCLNGAGLIVKLLDGHRFVDGIAQKKEEKDAA